MYTGGTGNSYHVDPRLASSIRSKSEAILLKGYFLQTQVEKVSKPVSVICVPPMGTMLQTPAKSTGAHVESIPSKLN